MLMGKWLGRQRNTPAPTGRSDLDIFLAWALQSAMAGRQPRFPVEYLGLIRECLEPRTLTIADITSRPGATADSPGKRFAGLVGALARLPPIEFAVAEKIARIADELRSDFTPMEAGGWAGDVSAHFEMSSSFGLKGRILATIIRYMQARRCLELGTAYGISALFMLESAETRLTTVEGSPLPFALASAWLRRDYGERVACVSGWTDQVLPDLVPTLGQVEFLFHDAGHSRQDYIRDFQAVLPALAPGAVALFDDIRWYDPRFCGQHPRCYQGWREIAAHPRVRRAVEINREMGLILFGE